MKPDKLTIHELLQRERRYVVSRYQRAYVWGQQGQWEPSGRTSNARRKRVLIRNRKPQDDLVFSARSC